MVFLGVFFAKMQNTLHFLDSDLILTLDKTLDSDQV